jgi:hypothetical protein
LHIFLKAEWNRKGYKISWQFSTTTEEMIIPWRQEILALKEF